MATVRALKHHGGASKDSLAKEDLTAVRKGFCNLEKHIENIQHFGINPIVCINAFPSDTAAELQLVKDLCSEKGSDAVVSTAFSDGGKGSAALAEAVVRLIDAGVNHYHPLYQLSDTIEHKIKTVATKIYGAEGVEYASKARTQLALINKLGFNEFPVCMAKTPLSFSDDEKKTGRPTGFKVTVREFEYAAGAGFVVPLLGDVMRMPGLPSIPSAEHIDISIDGKVTGLF